MKYASKQEFIDRIEREHARFVDLATSIPSRRYREEGVWGEGWTVKDLFAHLTEWEQMFLGWHRAGLAEETPAMPAEGYKWNELARLNRAIWKKHRNASWKRVHASFEQSYEEVLALAKSLTGRQLLTPGCFPWTKKHPLTTYLGANTCSHYSSASNILRRWMRAQNIKN